jgi:undecaprenyl-diphosphatase
MTPSSPAWLWPTFLASLSLALLLTLAVATGRTARLDAALFEALRHRVPPRPDGKPRRLTTAARDLTALGGDTLRLGLFLCATVLLACDRRGGTAAALVALFAGARLALFLLKALVRRPRPAIAGETIVTYTSSFPSGHTFMAGVLFLSAALLIPLGQPPGVTVAAVAFALAASLAIGLTRTAFAIHWPTDVAVGWLGAIAWVSGGLLLGEVIRLAS